MMGKNGEKFLVCARGICKEFGMGSLKTQVLHNVDIEILRGDFTLLMGPSGSGKTTLISILAGVMSPTKGTVELLGEDLAKKTQTQISRIRRNGVGFVFQQYNLFEALTARDNVAEVLKIKGMRRSDANEKATNVLRRVGLEDRMKHRPHQLSGGQKQRVAIARALAGDPSIVIGDEVTGALDGKTAGKVMEILRDCVTSQRGVLVVTHDNRMRKYADRVVTLEDGRIVSDERLSVSK